MSPDSVHMKFRGLPFFARDQVASANYHGFNVRRHMQVALNILVIASKYAEMPLQVDRYLST